MSFLETFQLSIKNIFSRYLFRSSVTLFLIDSPDFQSFLHIF